MSYLSGVRSDWVWTRLQNGDMLSTLATMYHVGAKDIVLGNGIPWNSVAIEGDAGWVHARGSRTKIGARWVFDSNTTILLPRGGQRSEVGAGTPAPAPIPEHPPLTETLPKDDVKEAGIPPIALAIGAAGLAFLVLGGMKKKKGERTLHKNPRRRKVSKGKRRRFAMLKRKLQRGEAVSDRAYADYLRGE